MKKQPALHFPKCRCSYTQILSLFRYRFVIAQWQNCCKIIEYIECVVCKFHHHIHDVPYRFQSVVLMSDNYSPRHCAFRLPCVAFVLLLSIAVPIAAPRRFVIALTVSFCSSVNALPSISPYSQVLITGIAASAPPALMAPAAAIPAALCVGALNSAAMLLSSTCPRCQLATCCHIPFGWFHLFPVVFLNRPDVDWFRCWLPE